MNHNFSYLIKKISLQNKKKLSHFTKDKVHSIYENTINLSVNNSIISLQPDIYPLSPIGILTEKKFFEKIKVKKNDILEINENCINLYGDEKYHIYLDSNFTEIRDLSLTKFSKIDENNIKNVSKKILEIAGNKGLGLLFKNKYSENIILDTIKNTLNDFKFELKAHKENTAIESLISLIGLGIGLTPSGDDFISGLLSAAYAMKNTDNIFFKKLITELKNKLKDTNDISREFLKCAINGEFGEVIHDFYNGFKEKAYPYEKIGNSFSKLGHTSGIDNLYGIYFASIVSKDLSDS